MAPAATSLVAALLASPPAHAQPVVGGFDDASVPSPWEVRLRLGI